MRNYGRRKAEGRTTQIPRVLKVTMKINIIAAKPNRKT